tara:strand:+ start:93 stop:314 length:222 start_codon:yes stop_codon:yes gene_type:complete
MKTIEFSQNEINVLLQLIDIAVKTGGLNVAEAGFTLAAKVSGDEASPPQVDSSPIFAEPAELANAPEEEEEES